MYGYDMDGPAVRGGRVLWSRLDHPEATAPPLPFCPPRFDPFP